MKIKRFNEMSKCHSKPLTKKGLLEEARELLELLLDKNYTIEVFEEDKCFDVKISLGNYWQKAMPKLLKWSTIKMDIIHYLHHVCCKYHVLKYVDIIRNKSEIESISLKKLESLDDCQIKSLMFRIDKEL